jgi:hypothetical protein
MMEAAVNAEALSEEQFLALVGEVVRAEPALAPLAAAVLVALHLGVAADSRDFARNLGVEHALALRELTSLAARDLIAIGRRNARTQRTAYAMTATGRQVLIRAGLDA